MAALAAVVVMRRWKSPIVMTSPGAISLSIHHRDEKSEIRHGEVIWTAWRPNLEKVADCEADLTLVGRSATQCCNESQATSWSCSPFVSSSLVPTVNPLLFVNRLPVQL